MTPRPVALRRDVTHVELAVKQVDETADLVAEEHVVTVVGAAATRRAVDAARVHQRSAPQNA